MKKECKAQIRVVFDDQSVVILEYTDNKHLFQACEEFDANNIRWEFV